MAATPYRCIPNVVCPAGLVEASKFHVARLHAAGDVSTAVCSWVPRPAAVRSSWEPLARMDSFAPPAVAQLAASRKHRGFAPHAAGVEAPEAPAESVSRTDSMAVLVPFPAARQVPGRGNSVDCCGLTCRR